MGKEAAPIRIEDVTTFLTLHRHGSVTGAARTLGVTPSQVSKALARLEAYVGTRLVSRAARGVHITEAGQSLLPRFQELLDRAEQLGHGHWRRVVLTVAAPSYLAGPFLPIVARAVPDVRIRELQVDAPFVRAYAGEDMFQLALLLTEETLPSSWTRTKIGHVRQAIFAGAGLARKLGRNPTTARVLEHPFVFPAYHQGVRFLHGDDGCPIPRAERQIGHEAATIGVAFSLAAECDQLVFGPEFAARALVQAGRLVELKIPAAERSDSFFLYANGDRVLARVHRGILDLLQSTMSA